MKFVFLGGFIPDELDKNVRESTIRGYQSAANNFQKNLIAGFRENNLDVCLVTAFFIGGYPKQYRKMNISRTQFSQNEFNGVCVPFVNVKGLKNYFKYCNIMREIKLIIDKDEEDFTIIVYSLNLAYVKAAVKLKEYNNHLKVCVVVPDLPEYPGDSSYLYKLYLNLVEKDRVTRLISSIDKFVLLSEAMADRLEIENSKYIVMEGMYNTSYYEVNTKYNYDEILEGKKVILYTGSLDERYGIIDLINSFLTINNEEYVLILCGDGGASSFVREIATKYNEVIYLGLLPVNEISYLQKKATLLVNPRSNNGEYNKYSFPSKTMEYLASGTPVLMHKLDGIPTEYDEFLFYFDGSSLEDMGREIKKYLDLDKELLSERGKKNREFVLSKKTSEYQVKRIIDFVV